MNGLLRAFYSRVDVGIEAFTLLAAIVGPA